MDPVSCLLAMEADIIAHDKDGAIAHHIAYTEWRASKGFEPIGIIPQHIADKTPRDGDELHGMLQVLFELTFD